MLVAKVLSTLLAHYSRNTIRNEVNVDTYVKDDCDISKCVNDLVEVLNRFSSPHSIVNYKLDNDSKVILSPKNIALYLINKDGEVFELNKKGEPLKSKGHILELINILNRIIK